MRPPRGGTGTKVIGNLTSGRNPVKPLKGGGGPDPETKVTSRGNFMKRKDLKLKVTYGARKYLKL